MFLNAIVKDRTMKKISQLCHEQSLIPLLTGEQMVQHPPVQKLLKELYPLTQLEEDEFSEIYVPLVTQLGEFMQLVPDIVGGRIGSLFDEALKRAWHAIQAQQLEDKDTDPRYRYLIFSAALLLDIRKIWANKRIMLMDSQGNFIEEWSPFTAQTEDATYYQVRQFHRPLTQLSPLLSIIFARQVMPATGFLWLAQDWKILNKWLAALSGDEEGAGGLWAILQIARQRLREVEEKPKFILPVEIIEPPEHEVAEAFWVWLKNIVATGAIDKNDPAIHVMEDLVFIDVPKIFKEFLQARKLPIETWQQLYDQFIELGLTAARDEEGVIPDQLMIYLTKDELGIQQKTTELPSSKETLPNKVEQKIDASKFPKSFFGQVMTGSGKKFFNIKKIDKSESTGSVPKTTEQSEGAQFNSDRDANEQKFARDNAERKEQQNIQEGYRQSALAIERGYFSKLSYKLEMEKQLKEKVIKRKQIYTKMVLRQIMARLITKRAMRMAQRFKSR